MLTIKSKHIKLILAITILIVISTLLTGCINNNKENNQSVKDISYLEDIEKDLVKFVNTGEKTDIFSDNLVIEERDLTDANYVNNKYITDSAIYIQIGYNMYRFQLDTDGIIIDYIKYSLEA